MMDNLSRLRGIESEKCGRIQSVRVERFDGSSAATLGACF